MGRIISLRGDDHDALQALLPWYATGQLDAADQAKVEAHLSGCVECQAELRFDRRLNAEIAALPIDVEQAWLRMSERLDANPREGADRPKRVERIGAAPWLGWAVAAALLVCAGALLLPTAPTARYHVLGAAPVGAAADIVVMFKPDATEMQIRDALNTSHARLVDGPTAADAYLLHAPPAQRASTLAALRAKPAVTLAQPVDLAP